MAQDIGTASSEKGVADALSAESLEVTGTYAGRTARHTLERMANGGWTCQYGNEDWLAIHGLAREDVERLKAEADRLHRPVSLFVRGAVPEIRLAYTRIAPGFVHVDTYDGKEKSLHLKILPQV